MFTSLRLPIQLYLCFLIQKPHCFGGSGSCRSYSGMKAVVVLQKLCNLIYGYICHLFLLFDYCCYYYYCYWSVFTDISVQNRSLYAC